VEQSSLHIENLNPLKVCWNRTINMHFEDHVQDDSKRVGEIRIFLMPEWKEIYWWLFKISVLPQKPFDPASEEITKNVQIDAPARLVFLAD
jgi:hypothetical protein